jgi:DNA-binding MarR family transcriptional regulator
MNIREYCRNPGFLIRRCNQILSALFAEQAEPYGITVQQLATLHAVGELPGLDQGRIAETIGVDRSTIGQIVERLAERGLLSAAPAPADRRTKLLTITPAGATIVEAMLAKLAPVRTRFLDPLTPAEQVAFIEMLERLTAAHNDVSRAPQRVASKRAAVA